MTKKTQTPVSNLAVLYSFRRCPYAMRARMALKYSGIDVYLREIDLKNKPLALIQCSAKGTVPILVLNNGTVLDESRDIMLWALANNDPEQWLPEPATTAHTQMNTLLDLNDQQFKTHLDHYKYADRYPEHGTVYYRQQGEKFLLLLEECLRKQPFLQGDRVSITDIGIFPFIRQFAFVDSDWFSQSPYHSLRNWLETLLQSELFISIMEKYKPWQETSAPIILEGLHNKQPI